MHIEVQIFGPVVPPGGFYIGRSKFSTEVPSATGDTKASGLQDCSSHEGLQRAGWQGLKGQDCSKMSNPEQMGRKRRGSLPDDSWNDGVQVPALL